MSDFQSSNYGASPVTLYQFTRGKIMYRYASADRDITLAGVTYTAIPISDSGFIQSGETQDDNVTITLPWTADVVVIFNGTAPSDQVFVNISRLNFGDTVAYALWSGSISEVKRTNQATAEITCETIAQSFERNGLTLSYSRTCPYFLYDPHTCTVDPANWATPVTLASISGNTLTGLGFGAGGDTWFTNGFIEWPIDDAADTFERRAIASQSGTTAVLIGLPDGLSTGQEVTAYPGCDRSNKTCDVKFNNLANCGCAPFLPGISPFDNINVF